MFYFLLCFLFIFRTTFGDNDPCKDPRIDAMTRVKYSATQEIYIYSGEYYYKFNVKTRELDIEGGTKIVDTWPEVEPPITGAGIFLQVQDKIYMAFARDRKMWLYQLPSIGDAGDKYIVDMERKDRKIGSTSQKIEAMRWNSNAEDPDFKIRICYKGKPYDCTFDPSQGGNILPGCKVSGIYDVQDCRAVTSAKLNEEEILLISFAKELHYYTKDDTPKNQEVLNIKDDVFGCKSMDTNILLTVALIVLAVGVALLLIALIPLIIVLVIRRRKLKVRGPHFNEDTSIASRTGVKSKG